MVYNIPQQQGHRLIFLIFNGLLNLDAKYLSMSDKFFEDMHFIRVLCMHIFIQYKYRARSYARKRVRK